MPLLTKLFKRTRATKMAPPLEVSDILTISDLYKQNKLSPPTDSTATPNAKYLSKISLIRKDITTLAVTAIVNAANESLLGGGGVDGAIHRAAGDDLLDECRTLDGCDTGSAKITGAYELPCKHVIHAVGPVYWSAKRKGEDVPEQLLAGCYTTSLDLLDSVRGCSIAFSALSTGVYGYPSDEAAKVAVAAVKGWLDADEARAEKVERIVFCSFLEKDERAYEEVVPHFFPPTEADIKEAEGDSEETKTQQQTGDFDGTADGAGGSKNVADTKDVSDDKLETATEDGATVPELPEVPKDEPKEPGQPDHKKVKLDDGKLE